jgi:hypothetical protein
MLNGEGQEKQKHKLKATQKSAKSSNYNPRLVAFSIQLAVPEFP